MPPRPLSSCARVLPWAALASLLCFGCSSDEPRDMNYGTDAGLGYEPPDAPVRTDAAPDDSESPAETHDYARYYSNAVYKNTLCI